MRHHSSNVTGLTEMARSEKQNIVALLFLAHLDFPLSNFFLNSVFHLTGDHPMQVLLSKFPVRFFLSVINNGAMIPNGLNKQAIKERSFLIV